MAFSLGSELGLRLLLSPAGTSAVVRTACVAIGVGFPVYATFKAIESKEPAEQNKWLVYWTAYGCFSVAEYFSDTLLSWCPLYYHAKLAFLVWLQFPNNFGANYVYTVYMKPFFLKRKVILDRFVETTRNDINGVVKNTKESKEFQTAIQMAKNATCSVWEALVRGDNTTTRRASSPEDASWIHIETR